MNKNKVAFFIFFFICLGLLLARVFLYYKNNFILKTGSSNSIINNQINKNTQLISYIEPIEFRNLTQDQLNNLKGMFCQLGEKPRLETEDTVQYVSYLGTEIDCMQPSPDNLKTGFFIDPTQFDRQLVIFDLKTKKGKVVFKGHPGVGRWEWDGNDKIKVWAGQCTGCKEVYRINTDTGKVLEIYEEKYPPPWLFGVKEKF